VTFAVPATQSIITVPLQALVVEGGATHAWRYDASTGTVQRTRVAVGNVAGNDIVIADGLAPGDIVVTAGAHQLQDGQKVKLLTEVESASAFAPTPLKQTLAKRS
jgi:hypothetical protein